MEGWMEGWKDGRMDGWMDGWMNGWVSGQQGSGRPAAHPFVSLANARQDMHVMCRSRLTLQPTLRYVHAQQRSQT